MQHKNMKKNMFSNSLYTLLNTLFPLVCAMYAARLLLPDTVGRISYAQNIVAYFVSFAPLGIPQYGIREISRAYAKDKNDNRTFTELFVLNLVSTLFCSAAYLLLVLGVPRFRAQLPLYLVTGIILFLNAFNVDWWYSGREEYDFILRRNIIVKLCCLAGLFLFVHNEGDYLVYAVVFGLGGAGNYLLNALHLTRQLPFEWKGLNIKQHIKPVTILLLSVIANDIYTKVDTTMIGAIRTEAEVAYYTYAISITRNLCVLTAAISRTTLPKLSALYVENNAEGFSRLVNKTAQLILLLVLPAAIGLFLVADEVVCTLFGQAYLPAANVLRILAPIVLVISLCGICGQMVLIATNREKHQLTAMVGGSVINIALNAFLIPTLGITGAAVASLASEVVVLVMYLRHSLKGLVLRAPPRFFSSLAGACVALVVVVLLVKQFPLHYTISLAGCIGCGALAYGIALLMGKNPVVCQLVQQNLPKSKRG